MAPQSPLDALSPEQRKRRRERRWAALFAIVLVISSILQALLTRGGESYGFVNSLLYFGLVNVNVLLVGLVLFLIVRNVIKAYLARRSGTLGSSLRWKMVTSLLVFSLVPALFLFAASTSIIRQGFDRWFGQQVGGALEDAQAITKVHYDGVESNLNFFADAVAQRLRQAGQVPDAKALADLRLLYPIQALEVYDGLIRAPLRSLDSRLPDWIVPKAAVESLQRASRGEDFLLIRQYGDGDLVQAFRSLPLGGRNQVVVLSHSVPLGLKTRIAELQSAFGDYKRTAFFRFNLKRNYTLILFTLFLIVVFVALWFGLYLARSVTEPVSELMQGTEAFRRGQWDYRIPTVLSLDRKALERPGADLEVLKASFNQMAEEVGRKGRLLEEANVQLTSLVRELEERERYLEILLSSIRRGVVVLDPRLRVQRINVEALDFAASDLRVQENVNSVLHKSWAELFPDLGNPEELRAWLEEARAAEGSPLERIFEHSVGSGRSVTVRSIRVTAIWLLDDERHGLGWMLILEDVTDAARLERLAAWQEVARRVAHEIKNPLTPIQISADRLYRRMAERMESDSDGELFRECVSQIQKQVRVIRNLVREFSDFAKLPEPKLGLIELAPLLEKILADYRFMHPDCRFLFRSHLPPTQTLRVRADAEYIRRLVVNLADNALHSMQEAKISQPEFCITLQATSPRMVGVSFEDNGPGVPDTMREKVFDPYVSSKASGFGLGLSIVRRIAMEHAGRVRCEAGPGGRFVLELPVAGVEDRLVIGAGDA